MKITVDIDCTPEEARAFMGLPDVRLLQESMMREVETQMSQSLQAMGPEQLMKTWMPAAIQGLEQLQRFWGQIAAASVPGGTSSDPTKK